MKQFVTKIGMVGAGLALLAGSALALSQRDINITSSSVVGGFANGTMSVDAQAGAQLFADTIVIYQTPCQRQDGSQFDSVTNTIDNRHLVRNVTPVIKNKRISEYSWQLLSSPQDPNGFNTAPTANPCGDGVTELGSPVEIASGGRVYLSTNGGQTIVTDQQGNEILKTLQP